MRGFIILSKPAVRLAEARKLPPPKQYGKKTKTTMYNTGYLPEQRMCDLVSDRYAVLQVMSRFGIALGFGDKTVAEVCAEHKVDTTTFLAVVNLSV